MKETVTVTIELDDVHPIERSIQRIEIALNCASEEYKSRKNRDVLRAACRILYGWKHSLICLK